MPFFCAPPHRASAFSAALVVGICFVFVLSLPLLSAGFEIVPPTPKAPSTPQEPSADPDDFIEGNYWALIIGINKYPTLPLDKQLYEARKDAEAVAKLLRERYGFSGKRMIELYDEAASRKGIIRACSSMKRRLTDKDSLFIYYAGHGEYESTGKDQSGKEKRDGMGYWIPSNAELDDPSSYIFNSQMRDYAANIPARHIFLVVDSVFSGSLMGRTRAMGGGNAAIKELYQRKSRWVLASDGFYPAHDDSARMKNGHSAFAWDFMKRLRQNTAPYLPVGEFAPSSMACLLMVPRCLDERPKVGPVIAAGDEGGQFIFRLRKESIEGGPAPKDYKDLEEQLKEAEGALKKQQEEMAKRKQEVLDRIKKAQEDMKRQAETAPQETRPEAEKKVKDKVEGEHLEAMKKAREEAAKRAAEELLKNPRPVVEIPAGEFIMGSEPGNGQPDESPQRTVYLDAYTIDKYEVTVAQFAEYLKKSGAEPPDFWERVNQKENGNRPVVGVDWLEADEYCRFHDKRLPTEAQWEKAARGTDGRKYPWGNEDPGPLFANFAGGISFSYSKSLTHVGSYEDGKSPYGVYDMVGNVWEWVNDWYDKNYYQAAPPKNPSGPGDSYYVVIRGGSWSKRPAVARVAGRMFLSPNTRSNSVGFRCAGEAR